MHHLSKLCYLSFVVPRPIFFCESGNTVFQKNLLSLILLWFKFSKYCRFFSIIVLLNRCTAEHMQVYFFSFQFRKQFSKVFKSDIDCLIKFFIHKVFLVSSNVPFLNWCVFAQQVKKFWMKICKRNIAIPFHCTWKFQPKTFIWKFSVVFIRYHY